MGVWREAAALVDALAKSYAKEAATDEPMPVRRTMAIAAATSRGIATAFRIIADSQAATGTGSAIRAPRAGK